MSNITVFPSAGVKFDSPKHSQEEEEPLLKEDPHRFTLFPITWPDILKAYENHKAAFWTAQEIDYSSDIEDWKKLTGCPVILNTSLNVKGQPIVNDLGDCIEFTKRTGIPVLTEEI